jgi:predicted transposase YbfD/YdcC
VPVSSSLPIDAVVDYLCDVDAGGVATPDLLEVLGGIVDPRARRGVRHCLVSVLAVAVAAVVAGARSFCAIAEWAADAPAEVLAALSVSGPAPHESTIRRVLQALDADALDAMIGAWLAARSRPAGRRVIAVDGKSVRGAIGANGRARHLLAAIDHQAGVVLGQLNVDGKTNEISMFSILMDGIDIAAALVTADALHTQKDHARYLVEQRGAHYLFTVKGNQPKLNAQLRALPWAQVPTADTCTDRGHGRVERRSIKVVTVTAGLMFPHAMQAIQIIRRVRPMSGKRWHTVTVYAITSLTAAQANPAQLADWARGHWTIENSLHWVRDVSFAEDQPQVRTGSGPQVMAGLRNLAISLIRLTGATNIAAALRNSLPSTAPSMINSGCWLPWRLPWRPPYAVDHGGVRGDPRLITGTWGSGSARLSVRRDRVCT